ncbi:MAG TPA: hypothetical protein VLJ37_11630 [bacterium]|nr:hypothetical protein [bacterium]
MIHLIVSFVLAAAFVMAGCGPRISKETYVAAMADMGCKMVMENSPGGEAVLKEKGISQADIDEFRKKSGRDDMMAAATEIANKVAACHGVK